MPHLHSIKLERQNFAFTKIIILRNSYPLDSKYKSMIESLGMMIHNNGLVSALSLIKNSDKTENALIYQHLAEWVNQKKVIGFAFDLNNDDLLENVLAIDDSRVILALTIEILSLTDAMKEILKAEVS